MTYHVNYFGLLAERRGLSDETLESHASTPRGLYQEIDSRNHLGLTVSDMRAAVNDEFVSWDHPLAIGDRVAFLPPMSGG